MATLIARDLAPDLVLFHGDVHTLWPDLPRCAAVACKDGRVVALGDDAEVLALAGPATERVDLGGRTLVPGINDAHNHMLELGLKLSKIQVEDCASIAAMVDLVRAAAERTPPGQWIVGEGWNESLFAEGRLPSRQDLDAATTRHPVLLKRFFNMDVVNSLALELGGVSRHTPDPQGGKVERDAAGEPTGILRAAAKLLCRGLLPAPTPQEAVAALDAAGQAYLAVGITSVLDPGLYPWEMRAYLMAREQGRLRVRVNLMPSWHGFREEERREELEARAAGLGVFSGLGDEWLSLGGLKMAVDGGTTSRTAWMFQPFLGEEKVHDYNRLDPEDLREFFARGHELGWDIGIHAIGDRAHHESALAFADAIQSTPSPRADQRHNLIHAYFASEESLQHMARHDIAAVIQPTFIYFEGDDLFRDVGAELAHRYKPARTYLDRGIRVVATSDIPSTAHYNPFVGLYSLVTRQSWKGTPIAPQEAISREEALHAYSVAGAWLTREEHRKGPLAPGFLADMIALDRDYFSCPEEEIKEIKVELTVVGGKVAYRR
ncbi:amidohydrolase [Oscillochloris sp. ZM17-4]|uniref:amidohydrolase n=1 Tax=Oscillochloris sp. ZM17-4 TaxID=2866714 RepID=UPI001C73037C|nr:amidohydrolase [Oscillochloris sp. ZM17-4]MBX0329643.1 amidohydrolase [Oscillochloris sp. ZM17-4]